MIRCLYLLAYATLLFSCRNEKIEQDKKVADTIACEPLLSGESRFGEEAFGDVIELKGNPIPTDFEFKVFESKMLIKDSLLILKNRNGNYNFMAFSLPGLRHLKSFGFYKYERSFGLDVRGVDELYPKLVPVWDKEYPAGVYNTGNLYYLTRDFKLVKKLNNIPYEDPRDDYQLIPVSDSVNFIIKKTDRGCSVFLMNCSNNSISVDSLFSLSLFPNIRSWAAYSGDFEANPYKKRLVYAYRYFKRLKFMDFSGQNARDIIFSTDSINERKAKKILGPERVTHYWGISSGKNYVYVFHSGRTPLVVAKELQRGNGYGYIEQFDWNGNPVRRFKLDHWGYFCVNEDEDRIYLLSVTSKDPFIVYDLPKTE